VTGSEQDRKVERPFEQPGQYDENGVDSTLIRSSSTLVENTDASPLERFCALLADAGVESLEAIEHLHEREGLR
jgi:hypothetical protein